jgi:hypothetical protein
MEVRQMKKPSAGPTPKPSQLITDYIAELGDWRGSTLARLRKIIGEASPELSEEWKWGSPVWAHNGLVCAASAFKDHVKVNFLRGRLGIRRAYQRRPRAKVMRSIDFRQGDKIDATALKALVRAAVAQNAPARARK